MLLGEPWRGRPRCAPRRRTPRRFPGRPRRGSTAAARRAARARTARRCRSRRAAGSRRGRDSRTRPCPRPPVERAQRLEHLARIVARSRAAPARRRRAPIAAISCSSSADAPAETGAASAHQAEQLGRGNARSSHHVREEVARSGRPPRPCGACAGRSSPRGGRGSAPGRRRAPRRRGVGIDRLQLAVGRDRGRLDRLVPGAELLPPELAREELLRAPEARGTSSGATGLIVSGTRTR